MRNITVIICLILLEGCNLTYKETSFSTRKFTKGYFSNMPSAKPIKVSKSCNIEIKKNIQITKEPSIDTITVDSHSLKRESNSNKLSYTSKTSLITEISVKPIIAIKHFEVLNNISRISNYKQLTDTKTDPDTKTSSILVTIGFVFAILVLAILGLGLILMALSGNGITVLLTFAIVSAIPAIGGIIFSIITLCLKNDNHVLAIISLVICLLSLLLLLLLF